MTTINTYSLAPDITIFFDKGLLSEPCFDGLKRFWNIYQYIKKKLIPKAKNNVNWKEKVDQLERYFLELYERAQAKEKDNEGKKRNKTQEPLYRISFPNKRDDYIFGRLRYKRIRSS